jgi:hypothetical protein
LVSIGLVVSEEKIFEKVYDVRQVMAIAHMALPTNMAVVTKNRTYGKIAGFWVIISEI